MFFHYFLPNPILFKIGPLILYWYGFLMFLAFWLGVFLILKLAPRLAIKKEIIFNLIFWLFIFGLLGARFYHVFAEFDYYRQHPVEILFFWQGGLGLYGALISGVLIIYFYSRKHQLNFWRLLDLFSPAAALGLAIVRWGNYFNQELYGLPTASFLRIPISPENRVVGFEGFDFFQPLFFYESIFCFLLFCFLVLKIKKTRQDGSIILFFLFFYSTFRFLIEFLRLDVQPVIFGLRLGQVISLLLFIAAVSLSIIKKRSRTKSQIFT